MISIARRDRPFSHVFGTTVLIPRSCWAAQVFPTLLRLQNCEVATPQDSHDITLNLQGPVQEFMVEQDLERGCVFVSGVSKEGRYRIQIQAIEKTIQFRILRAPVGHPIFPHQNLHFPILGTSHIPVPLQRERLSLGSHRSQDWERVWQRLDLNEILPILFHLSQWIPRIAKPVSEEMQNLLEKGWEPFLRVAFSGILHPRVIDDDHQGILSKKTVDPNDSPCALFPEIQKRIRRMFLLQSGSTIELLPFSHFPFGRLIGAHLNGIGTLDFEWSKFVPRRCIIRPSQDACVRLRCPKPYSTFRIRTDRSEKGRIESQDNELELAASKTYWIDRFEK